MRPLPIPQHLLSLLQPQRFQSDLPYRPCHASASQFHDLHELFSPTSGRRQPQAMKNTASSGYSVGNWIEIEPTTVEVDALLKCSRLRKPRAVVLMVWIFELTPSVGVAQKYHRSRWRRSSSLSSALFASPARVLTRATRARQGTPPTAPGSRGQRS